MKKKKVNTVDIPKNVDASIRELILSFVQEGKVQDDYPLGGLVEKMGSDAFYFFGKIIDSTPVISEPQQSLEDAKAIRDKFYKVAQDWWFMGVYKVDRKSGTLKNVHLIDSRGYGM